MSQAVSEQFLEVRSILKRHFVIVDWQGIILILAAAIAHYFLGEMLWLRIIGPSRSGKTELLRALAASPDCAKMETMTPAAFRGGLEGGKRLLGRIDSKLVITKEMAPLLTKKNEDRKELFGIIRAIKDGEFVSDFGTKEGQVSQTASFDWILATTLYVEQERVLDSLLGERFVDLRWQPGNSGEMSYQAALNNPHLKSSIRPQLAAAVCKLMDTAKQFAPSVSLSDEAIRIISQYANRAARLRTPVQRDKYHSLKAFPEPEIGTDLAQGFCRIVQGLKLLRAEAFEPYLQRLVFDSMQSLRGKVYQAVVNGINDDMEIAKYTGLSPTEVRYLLEDLALLKGIIKVED